MTDEDIFVTRIVRTANRKNKEIFQRILEAAQVDKPTDECWAETHNEVKLTRNPVLERIQPQPQSSQNRQDETGNSDRIRISHHETEQTVIWQIEVEKKEAKALDYIFDGFSEFLARLLSTA